jgi:hypothetical protein
MKEKKCTCGDTETQHYENTDKCLVCGCKEFEEVKAECKHEWRCAEHKYQWTLYYCIFCLKEQVKN